MRPDHNTGTSPHDDFLLQFVNISKSFPGVKALDQINLDIKKAEVHALLGENGAGKSTLMKILGGKYQPDQGEIIYRGNKVHFNTPSDAIENGIILIHQELSLVSELTAAENIFLGNYPTKGFGRIDYKKLKENAREILDKLHCNFSENEIVGRLSIAKQQMVEIARALAFNPTIVIFDEPTASLTDQEKESLFENINRLRAQGVTMVYISHRMNEIFEISDSITVLRDGKKTGQLRTKDTNEDEVTQLMIGRTIEEKSFINSEQFGDEVLRLENVSSKNVCHNISFSIRKGEILGLYGLVGAGRSEVAETIFGIRDINEGKVYMEGKEVRIDSSVKAVELGIGFVPENRKEQGLILSMSVSENMNLVNSEKMNTYGFIHSREELKIFKKYQEELSISTTGPEQKVVNLSGGNQQKIVIAKWLSIHPKLLILDEPTRGIDVGSKTEIHRFISMLSDEGYAVLVISSEMPEIIAVSNRVITMQDGRITGEFTGEHITESNLIQGITQKTPAKAI